MGSLNNENKDEIRIFPNTIHKNTRSKWEGGDYDIHEENIYRTLWHSSQEIQILE